MRPAVLIFMLGVIGLSTWYFVGGGRQRIEESLSNMASHSSRLEPREAVELVRNYRAGPQDQTVLTRLDYIAERLDARGISLHERRWDCTENLQNNSYLVTCLLRAPDYENQLQWQVDRSSQAVSPSNGPAADLDHVDLTVDPRPSGAAARQRPPVIVMGHPVAPPASGDDPANPPPGGWIAPPAARGQHPAVPSPPPFQAPPAPAPAMPLPGGPPAEDNAQLVGVMTGKGGKRALLQTGAGNISLEVGGKIGGWTVTEINHRSNGESTVVLRREHQLRELRMTQSTAVAPSTAGIPPPRIPHTPPSFPPGTAAPPPHPSRAAPAAGHASPADGPGPPVDGGRPTPPDGRDPVQAASPQPSRDPFGPH